MEYNTKKEINGQTLFYSVEIYPNKCKFTTTEGFAKGDVFLTAGIAQGYTGNITLTGGDVDFFANSNPYFKIDNEVIKVSIIEPSSGVVTIISRGEFGTEDVAHTLKPARLLHSGEADGSCYGFPRLPNGDGCSSPDSFDKDSELKMVFPIGQLIDGTKYFNGLDEKSLNHKPTVVKAGESMGSTASFSCSINDNADDDVYTVPYANRRTGKSLLFKKLFARHPHLENRRLIFNSGFINNGDFKQDEVISREYIIDKAELVNGKLSITALDPTILAEESKALKPRKSSGLLVADINNASTQFQVKDFVADEYGATSDAITVRIDKELISCTINDAATGLFDIVSRAVQSEEKDHKINTTVQLCIVLTNWNPIEEIEDTYRNYTSIDNRFIDDYTDAITATPNATGPVYISQPIAANKYINEIIRTWSGNGIAVYFKETEQLIKIKASSDFSQQPITLDYKADIKDGKVITKSNTNNQFTRATTAFARSDSGEKPSDDNSSIKFTSISSEIEISGLREPNAKKDFVTRFLSNSDSDIAIAVAGTSRIVGVNKEKPTIYQFDIDYKDYGNVEGGFIEEAEIINITTDEECNMDGSDKSVNAQIISLKDNAATSTYTLVCQKYQDIITESDFDFIIDSDKENYDLSTKFAPTEAGNYSVFIKSGVTIGATSTLNSAFTTGSQLPGVTFDIIHRGSILSAGGAGANGPDGFIVGFDDMPIIAQGFDGLDGFDGGVAMELTVQCTIDTSQGVIYAGGGGAPSTRTNGGNTYNGYDEFNHGDAGNGGSGGQGYATSSGGSGGIFQVDGAGVVDTGEQGVDGNRSSAGALSSISGGDWGEDSSEESYTGAKGLSGLAIKSNGNSVTITGDNNLTIKGRRS